MKPLQDGTKTVLKVGAFEPANIRNKLLPDRVSAKDRPKDRQGAEGFRASMIVSRRRIVVTAAAAPSGISGSEGASSAPPKLPA